MQGVDAEYDEAEAAIAAAEKGLKAYLREARDDCDAGKEITYISLQKESHVLEIPQVSASRVIAFAAFSIDNIIVNRCSAGSGLISHVAA